MYVLNFWRAKIGIAGSARWGDVCTVGHRRGQFCTFTLSLLNLILFATDPRYQLGKQLSPFVPQLLTCGAKLCPGLFVGLILYARRYLNETPGCSDR